MKKQRFSFLGNQSGAIIMTTLAVVTIISIAGGLWSFGTKAQEAKQGLIDVTRYADSKNTADPNKAQKNNQAILVSTAVEGGETAVSALNPDDTQIISMIDSGGAFNLPDKKKTPEQIEKAEAKKQNDIKIGETLKKNKLPSDQLTKDVTKGVQKIVDTNSKLDTDDDTKENVVIDIIGLMLQDISNNKAKSTVLDTVKKELDNQKILADEKVAETKKELNSALSEKEYIEKEIAVYDDLHAEGYLVTDKNDLSYWKERLDSANKQIAKLDNELEVLKQGESEKQKTADLTEKQGQDDTLSQDTASESGTALEETTIEETAAEEEITTEEETAASDANLIHGVVPTKVTAYSSGTASLGKWDIYLEFWNVGKLGGEQYAKVTGNEVLIEPDEGVETFTLVIEGYFTGGPNGDMELSITGPGGTSTVLCKLKDGKEVITEEAFSILINNPEAFKGWVD